MATSCGPLNIVAPVPATPDIPAMTLNVLFQTAVGHICARIINDGFSNSLSLKKQSSIRTVHKIRKNSKRKKRDDSCELQQDTNSRPMINAKNWCRSSIIIAEMNDDISIDLLLLRHLC